MPLQKSVSTSLASVFLIIALWASGLAIAPAQLPEHQSVLQYGNAYSATPAPPAEKATQKTPVVVQKARITHTANESADTILKHLLDANNLPTLLVEKFEFQDEDVLNAATDGRVIYFTNKLWNLLGTNDRRAFVIAHELSHIQHAHVPKAAARRVGLTIFGRLFSGWLGTKSSAAATIANQATQAGITLADLRFSRSAEFEADESGVLLMVNAGYDANGAIETLTILEENSAGGTPQFLLSHPLNPNRIKKISAQYHLTTAP